MAAWGFAPGSTACFCDFRLSPHTVPQDIIVAIDFAVFDLRNIADSFLPSSPTSNFKNGLSKQRRGGAFSHRKALTFGFLYTQGQT